MNTHKWTDEEFIVAVKESQSVRQTLIALGKVPVGGNYETVKRHVKRLNLDTSHWKGQGWNKGKTFNNRNNQKDLKDYLVVNGPLVSTSKLKNKLIKKGLLQEKCYICSITNWLENRIIFHLDHINGNRRDNRINNLRLLCPNCHSQTKTYCGRNIGNAVY